MYLAFLLAWYLTSMVFDLPFYLCWLLVFFTPMRRYRYVHYEFDELKTQWQDDKKWIFDKGKKQWRKEKKQARRRGK